MTFVHCRVRPSRHVTILQVQSRSSSQRQGSATCQVAIATSEEGTAPMAADTHPPTRVASAVRDLHPWPLRWFCFCRASLVFETSQRTSYEITAEANRSDSSNTHSCTVTRSPVTCTRVHLRTEGTGAERSKMKLNFIDHCSSKQLQDTSERNWKWKT